MAQPQHRLSIQRFVEVKVPGFSKISFATVDPDGRIVALATDSGRVYVHHIATGRTKQVALRQRGAQTCLTAASRLLAACHDQAYCLHKLSFGNEIKLLQNTQPHFPWTPKFCSLSADAQFLGLVCKDARSGFFSATVYNRFDCVNPLQTWTENNCDYINFSPDGATTFLRVANQFVAYDTLTGSYRAALSIDRTATDSLVQLASDQTTDHVAVADSKTLRIWNVNNLQAYPQILPHYDPPSSSFAKTGTCAISRDGSRVVAAIAGEIFALWDTVSSSRIATLDAKFNYRVHACALRPDGSSIVTISDDLQIFQKRVKIRVWSVPVDDQAQPAPVALQNSSSHPANITLPNTASYQTHSEQHIEHNQSTIRPAPTLTVLEHAFAKILSDPALLDHSFIIDHISANNVNTASDLLAGHNIILLAIRAGVITRNNIHTIGGSSWYLQDNLYLPATKLTDENGDLLDAVFHHAESLGIVKDGHKFKMAREFRRDVENRLQSIGHAVTDLAQRLYRLGERVAALETDVRNMGKRMDKMASNEQNLQEAVIELSEALKHLQDSIHKDDKRLKYASVAKCLLSFIPLVGQAVGEVSYTVVELIMNYGKKDVVSDRVEQVRTIATQVRQVDLSNLEVARCAFSQEVIEQLASPAREAVLRSVRESGFESANELEDMFAKLVSEITTDHEPWTLFDTGSSAMQSRSSSATTAGSSSQRPDSLDREAQNYFQYLTTNQSEKKLNIEETKLELNRVLERCKTLHAIDENTIENIFLEITDENQVLVSQELFMEMFQRVRKDQEEQNAMRAVLEECRQRFHKRARPRASMSIKMAARLLWVMDKEMMDRGIWRTRKCRDVEFAEQIMRKLSLDEIGNIDETKFISAVNAVFLTIEDE